MNLNDLHGKEWPIKCFQTGLITTRIHTDRINNPVIILVFQLIF